MLGLIEVQASKHRKTQHTARERSIQVHIGADRNVQNYILKDVMKKIRLQPILDNAKAAHKEAWPMFFALQAEFLKSSRRAEIFSFDSASRLS